jgi:hypothetical protein
MGRVQLSAFSQDSLCAAAQRIVILRSIFCHPQWPFRVSTYDRILPGLNDEATDGFGAFCGTFSFVFRLIYMAANHRKTPLQNPQYCRNDPESITGVE